MLSLLIQIIELIKIKSDAVVTIYFALPAFINISIGLKKIPPPIPITPEINPIVPPIKKETIKGAAIDVFADEPATDNILFGLDNVILTPHIAASTNEAQIIVAEMVANQFVDYFLRDIISNEVT